MFGFKKRHQETIEHLEALNGRINDLEYWLSETLRALATKADVQEFHGATQNTIENAVQRLDAFRLDEHERVHGIFKAAADRLELNAIRTTPGNRTAPGRE